MGFHRYLKKKSKSGQAALMVAMLILIFLFLFQFVVNVGLLVSAKINLQNAADIAAYAGAATQARQLNQIGILNYEMRRFYKKFLFRYYVVGGRAQQSWGKGPTRMWSPDGNEKSNFKVPAVCVIYNENDNFCQRASTGKIPPLENVNPINVLQGSFNTQLKAYEDVRQNECKLIGDLNRDLLTYWLYKSTVNEKELEEAIQNLAGTSSSEDQKRLIQRLNTLKLLIDGVGLVPRLMFLNLRIHTMADYINQKPLKGVKIGNINDLNGDQESQRFERTIQAFLSAYHSLGDHTFSASDIVMDELLPEGSDNNAELIRLNKILANFEAYYIKLVKEDGGDFKGPTGKASDCRSFPQPIPVRQLPLGVYKDPKVLTYYSVRVKAPVRLLFNPFGVLEMKAYSMAKPFGSRIGPRYADLQEERKQDAFVIPGLKGVFPFQPGLSSNCSLVGSIGGQCFGVPNLPLMKDDAITGGFNYVAVQEALDKLVVREQDGDKGPARDLSLAYQAAMAPNPYEKGKYLIPYDVEGDPFQDFFNDTQLAHGMWAPIENLAKKGSLAKAEIDGFIETLPDQPPEMVEFKKMLSQLLGNYLQDLSAGKGEPLFRGGDVAMESFSTVKVSNPVKFRTPAGSSKNGEEIFQTHKDFFTNQLQDLRTSWMSTKDNRFEPLGRVGYSVKFTPFKSILNPSGETTDFEGNEVWSNRSILDAEAERDLGGRNASFIQH